MAIYTTLVLQVSFCYHHYYSMVA